MLVQVASSTLNYKDALAITGKAPVVRSYPMVPGIDLAGMVVESSDQRYRPGDPVLLNGWGVGESHWGGLAQRARVKADWLVPLPAGMAPSQAMAIGPAGHTAMLCVMALLTGASAGTAQIALQRHVGRAVAHPSELKTVFSWIAIAPAMANFLGPLVTGLLIDHAGFQAAFGVMAVLPLASWYWVRGTPELPLPKNAEGDVPPRAWDLLAIPQMRRLLVINWMLSSCWDVHTFVLPVLGHERGFSASVIAKSLCA